MEGEGVGEEEGCLGVGKVCVHTRGDWAAVNMEVDMEVGGLGYEEFKFSLESRNRRHPEAVKKWEVSQWACRNKIRTSSQASGRRC